MRSVWHAARKNTLLLAAFLLLAIYANFFDSSLRFEPEYSLYPDSVNLYPMNSFNDRGLYPGDALTAGLAGDSGLWKKGVGFYPLYRVLLKILSLPLAIKLVSVSLFVLSLFALYLFACRVADADFALLFCGSAALYFLSMDSFYGGQGRCFGAFLYCLFLLFMSRGMFLMLPLVCLASLYFYPVLSATLACSCVIAGVFFRKQMQDKEVFYAYLLSLIALFILFVNFHFSGTPLDLKGFQSYKYSQNVRAPLDGGNPAHIFLYFMLNLNEHSRLYLYSTLFILACCLFLFLRLKKDFFRVPEYIVIMAIASFVSFAAIYPLHPVSASRQMVFTVPLLLVYLFSNGLRRLWLKNRRNISLFLAAAAAVFISAHPFLNDTLSYRRYGPIYEYAQRLPKGVMLAGYPSSLCVESIPFFGRRQVFYMDRTSDVVSVYGLIGRSELLSRRKALVRALFCGDPGQALDFMEDYKIDYLIIDGYIYSQPFIHGLRNSLFPEERRVYRDFSAGNRGFVLKGAAEESSDYRLLTPEGGAVYVLSRPALKRAITGGE